MSYLDYTEIKISAKVYEASNNKLYFKCAYCCLDNLFVDKTFNKLSNLARHIEKQHKEFLDNTN